MTKLLFLGSGEVPVPILKKLAKSNKIKVAGIVITLKTKNSKDRIRKIIENFKIPIFETLSLSKDQDTILSKTKPDIILVCNFGQILNESILEYPKHGCLNIHASLLPKLRGACPIEAAILQGLDKTGLSIQLMEKELDTGDILFQKSVKILENETGGSLLKKLQTIATNNIEQVILDWVAREIKPKKQNHTKATYCYKKDISKEAARIDWGQDAKTIERKIRAFNPRIVAWTILQTKKCPKRFKIFQAEIAKINIGNNRGSTQIKNGKLYVQTGKGSLILKSVQLEGKKQMNTSKFLSGFKEKIIFQ